MIARPLSDLPRFLTAVAVQSKEAAAEASNAAALVLVRAIRQELPTRRLRSRAVSGGKRTGTSVNYAYREADPARAKYKPTALVVGRGPVHLLENDIKRHRITLGVRRGPDGRIRDIVSPGGSDFRRRRSFGPQLGAAGVGTGSTISVGHPGVRRSTGPFQRGVARADGPALKKWQKVFADESLRVKGW